MASKGAGWAQNPNSGQSLVFKSLAVPRNQASPSTKSTGPSSSSPALPKPSIAPSDSLLSQLALHLLRMYSSVDLDVITSVLEATGGNVEQAEALLADMAVEGASPSSPLPPPSLSRNASGTNWSDHDGESAADCPGAALALRKQAAKANRTARSAVRAAGRIYSSGGSSSEAQALSRKAQEDFAHAEALDRQAADLIFADKNKDKTLTEIDLHGLYRLEALRCLEERIGLLRSLLREGVAFPGASKASVAVGICTLRVITGKGRNSKDGEAVLGRAVSGWLTDQRIQCHVRPGSGSLEATIRP